MAVLNFNRVDLEGLIGKTLTKREYSDVLPMMGFTLEGLDEETVSFDITPDRPDMYSIEGFARGVQGFLGVKKGLPEYEVKKSKYDVHVDKSVLGTRGCAAFAVVKGYKFTEETVAGFMQLQDKLTFTIGRNRKKAAMGTYHLGDINFPVKYTTVKPDYKFTPLLFNDEMTVKEVEEQHPKGQEYKHLAENWKEYPAYIDAKGNTMAVLPYTNAQFGRIREDTENMFIEVTGTAWKPVMEMMNVVTTALADRGAEIYEVKAIYPDKKVVTTPDLTPQRMKLDLNYVNKLLDLNMKPGEVKAALEKMRVGFDGKDAIVPAYRMDVMHPIDIVEDIAVGHGYDKFEPRLPEIGTIGKPNARNELANTLRTLMVGLGFQEGVNFVLSNKEKEFTKAHLPETPVAEIKNPRTVEYTICRSSLLPGLLQNFSENASSEMPQKLFEIGITVQLDSKFETGAKNVWRIGGGILHSEANYSEAKANVEAFLNNIGKKYSIRECEYGTFIPGRVVEVLVGNKVIGVFGEVSPDVLSHFGIEYPVTLFEFDVEGLR
ncbi:MAG: phenylalanine--tRNA ligase subunit beta [archaeon]